MQKRKGKKREQTRNFEEEEMNIIQSRKRKNYRDASRGAGKGGDARRE